MGNDPTAIATIFPATGGGLMFFGTYAQGAFFPEGPWLVADKVLTGENVWATNAGSAPAESPEDGYNLLTFNDGLLYSVLYKTDTVNTYVASSNTPVWSQTLNGSIDTIPTIGSGVMLLGYSDRQQVTALSTISGDPCWNFTTDSYVISTPAYSNGNFYFTTLNGTLYCNSVTDGTNLWQTNLESPIELTPAVGLGTVIVGAASGLLYALDSTSGQKLWTFDSQGQTLTTPVLSANGIVYVGTSDGAIVALNVTDGNTFGATIFLQE